MIKLCLCGLSLFFVVGRSGNGPLSKTPVQASSFVDVGVMTQTWLDNYLKWAHLHPEVMSKDSEPLMLGMPYLELFSPTGESLYRGSKADQNAAFLHGLEKALPLHSLTNPRELRPTFEDYLEIVPELRPYKAQLLAEKKATIFAVTYTDKAFCKPENDALLAFKNRSDFRIVEVRLQSGGG